MYKITHKQKLDLRIIERWATASSYVKYTDWIVLSTFLGWTGRYGDLRSYDGDTNCELCIHTTYTEEQRTLFNKIRAAYTDFLKTNYNVQDNT